MKLFFATVGICLGSGLVAVILSAANTALPTIRADFGVTLVQIQWVVNIAAVSRGSLVATIGRFADMFGRKRVFMMGMSLQIVAVILAGFAPRVEWLMVAMGLVGMGSAALLAVAQALLTHAYPPGRTGRALSFWSLALGLGIATGSLLAGGILEVASWRWVFFSTVPVALVAWGLAAFAVEESRDEDGDKKIDWPGLGLLVVGTGSIVTAIIQGPIWGWTFWPTVTLFAVGGVAYVLFLVVESRVSNPLLELRLFANRMFIAGGLTNFCFICFMLTSLFLVPLFLSFVLAAEPIAIGLVLLALAVPVILLSPIAGMFTDRFGPKPQIVVGLLILIGASIWMTTLSVETKVFEVALPLLFYGLGWGALQGAAATAAITSLPKKLAGAASGGFVMMGGFGGAIGLAVGGTIVRSVYSAELNAIPNPGAFADAFHAGMWFLFGVSVTALVLVVVVMQGRRALLPLLFLSALPLQAADAGFAASAHQRHRDSGEPVTFGAKWGIDVLGNPIGGLRRGIANANALGVDMTVDVGRFMPVCGLEFHTSVVWRSGQSLSEKFIGNQFPVQQLFGGSNARLNELYLRQSLLCDRLELKLGRLNAGNDFLTSPLYYYYVLNGINGNPVSITFNTPFFVYQDSQWGAYAHYSINQCWDFKAGAFLGNLSVAENRYHGFNFTFAAPQGYMFLADGTYSSGGGHYTLGAYYVTEPTALFARSRRGGNYGGYLMVDQPIFCRGKTRITPWAAVVLAPSDRNEFPVFCNAGVVAQGLFPGRPCDFTNFGFVYGQYSRDKPGSQDYEINFELNHWFHIWKGIDFVPVIQYIMRPSGQSRIPNALTLGFQLSARIW